MPVRQIPCGRQGRLLMRYGHRAVFLHPSGPSNGTARLDNYSAEDGKAACSCVATTGRFSYILRAPRMELPRKATAPQRTARPPANALRPPGGFPASFGPLEWNCPVRQQHRRGQQCRLLMRCGPRQRLFSSVSGRFSLRHVQYARKKRLKKRKKRTLSASRKDPLVLLGVMKQHPILL